MDSPRRLLSFGEVMVRFAPNNDSPANESHLLKPSGAASWIRTVGGDELNVCVALQLLGQQTNLVSVFPEMNPVGEVVTGVSHLMRDDPCCSHSAVWP